jgi:8-oxo-dGTP pyrophosphatase MutT (NUDIX family)
MPGGHIDLGETLEEGVVRELKEETGIEVERKISVDGMKFEYFHNE